MTNYATGHQAEQVAAHYLAGQRFTIIALNWKTRLCEIDIVAKKKNVIYFVEVKHRKNSAQGGGLDYITPRKLKQMKFAAELWVAGNDWRGAYQLAAIELLGPDFGVVFVLGNI
jgi:uncharacterized protein (TIGR00252 family)